MGRTSPRFVELSLQNTVGHRMEALGSYGQKRGSGRPLSSVRCPDACCREDVRPRIIGGYDPDVVTEPIRQTGRNQPERKLKVLFLGAGASKAAGLPLTEELLQQIWPRAFETGGAWSTRRTSSKWNRSLSAAVKIMYPDGSSEGFRPPVSDFFTLLEVIDRVHSDTGRAGLDAGRLLDDLRAEVATGLSVAVSRLKRKTETPHYGWIRRESAERPQVIITSNWDTLAEQAAVMAGRRVHFCWPRADGGGRIRALPPTDLVVLKLHGSIDWGRSTDPELKATGRKDWEYERLDVPVEISGRPARAHRRDGSETVIRYRSIDHPAGARRRLAGFKQPLMATMAASKTEVINDIDYVWKDAYWILERAERLDIVGYSFPLDDLELRTLLRLSTRGGTGHGSANLARNLRLNICNPSPETHGRARSFLGSGINSSYQGAGNWRP
jgi:hypothetical protein